MLRMVKFPVCFVTCVLFTKQLEGLYVKNVIMKTARKDNLRRHVKSKHRDVKASAVNRTPVPNKIDPGNDISVQDIELMELTHDVAFSQYSDLLQISDDDDQPPIKVCKTKNIEGHFQLYRL